MTEQVFWSLGTWAVDKRIAVCVALSHAAAMVRLEVRDAWAVRECWTAELRAAALAEPEKVHMIEVDRLPSRYDKYKRPGFRGWDYDAMEEDGVDVS